MASAQLSTGADPGFFEWGRLTNTEGSLKFTGISGQQPKNSICEKYDH